MELDVNGLTFTCRTWGDGEPLLCLHGFPDDPGTFDTLADDLDGFRLVAPYMRGYGPTSAAPNGDYSPGGLGADAVALADELDARYILGHDWGAVAVYAALARGDNPFERVATMAVPPRFDVLLLSHPRQIVRSWYVWAFQIPLAAEGLLRAKNFALVDLLWGLWSPGWNPSTERLASVKETLATGETVEHALAYYRDMVQGSVTDIVEQGLPDQTPTEPFEEPGLLLAGADDGCIGDALFNRAEEAFERSRVVKVQDTGHFIHRERPGVVTSELEGFFN